MRVLICYLGSLSARSRLMEQTLLAAGHDVVTCNLRANLPKQGYVASQDLLVCDDFVVPEHILPGAEDIPQLLSGGWPVVDAVYGRGAIMRSHKDRHHKRNPQPNRGPIGRKQWS